MVQSFPEQQNPSPSPSSAQHGPDEHEQVVVIPEIQEEAKIGTRTVETGKVRIRKQVHEVERTFQPTLHDESIEVQRVPVNRVIQKAPEIRTEGETTVIPVVEEVMVKLLMLKEEIRVTRKRAAKAAEPTTVTLRREDVAVEREGGQPGAERVGAPKRNP